MINIFLFAILPYIAVTAAIVGAIWRYVTNRYSFSTISSQFLEGRRLFWGSVPWHWGIITVLLGHLFVVLLPLVVKGFISAPVRLYLIEGTGFALGMLLLFGLILLLFRRAISPRVRAVTSTFDVVLLVLLLVQAVAGLGIAIFYRWGVSWSLQTAVPWMWSLASFSPKVEYMADLPVLVKIHAVNAWVLIGIFPFTRLVHILSIPLAYIWRPYQRVTWYRRQPQQ
ncbi:MAG: respiratory nitrate reductase subunit gamma [Chloroflexi bacterium]|nr:respiratory nitrate reductase subunit gamma [Chloroflexota bacterium]